MASKQEYLRMMKRMEQGMGGERIPAPLDMGLDSMMNKPVVANKGIADPNFKNLNIPEISTNDLMEILRKTNGEPSDFTMKELEALKGSLSDREMDILARQRDDATKNSMGAMMGAMSDRDMKTLEDAMGGSVSDEIREAVSALISMGISLPDALEALNNDIGNSMSTRPETMVEGALGSLPTRTSDSVPDEVNDMFDADRTQSLDMQDSVNT